MNNYALPTLLFGAFFSLNVFAYSSTELHQDCLAAEEFYAQNKNSTPYQSIRGARCIAYIAGFSDGYGIADFLADKVGVSLNAICLPSDADTPYRLVRAVLAHLEHQPTNHMANTATLVAGALSKAFPCQDNASPRSK